MPTPKLTDADLRAIRVKYHPDQLYALYAGAGIDVNDYHTKRSVDAHYTDIPALLAHIRAQDAELARLRNDLAIIEQGCNSPWMTGAAFKDRVADLFAARRRVLAGDKTDEGE